MSVSLLRALREHAAVQPDAIALRGATGSISYAQLQRQLDTLADWLRAQRIHLLALRGENQINWVIADIAARQAGIALIPLPQFFSAVQLAHVLGTTALDHVLNLGPITEQIPTVLRVPSPVEGVFLDRVTAAPGRRQVVTPPNVSKITFTSGTTGQPKGVCLSDAMLDAVTAALVARIHQAHASGQQLSTHFALLPLSTLLENVAGVYVPLMLGKTAVLLPGAQIGLLGSSQLDLPRLLQTLHQHQPNSLIVLPQILAGLVAAAAKGMPPPSSLRFIAVGGAPTPPALLTQAQAMGLAVFEGYGLSECASVVSLNAPSMQRIGSVGQVLDHVRVRVVDGELQVAGNVFSGYLGQSAAAVHSEWFETGDMGHVDSDGYLYVTGRRKNLIISSFGRNISPEWLEAELSLCPSIDQAMVIGDGQPFCAAVVVPRSEGTPVDRLAQEITRLNATLPDYARIRRFIVAPEAFSIASDTLTDNGRLRRDAIAARHSDAIAALYSPTFPSHEPGVLHAIF